MFNIGPQELLLILLVALIVVGPKRLPELSRTIGKGLRELRKAQEEVRKTIDLGLDETEPTTSKGSARTGPASARTSVGASTAAASAEGADEGPQGAADDAAETESIARTLGRGLAELRRSRQEIQRTFRIDLSDRPSAPDRPSRSAPPLAREDAGPAPSPEAATRSAAGSPSQGSEDTDEPAPPDPRAAG